VDEAFSADLAGRLVAAPDAQIVIAQWADPGGSGDPPRYIAPLHVHHADDEAWYVLDGALVVRSGTRGQYGPAVKLPVSETTPSDPRGIYEISQLSAEMICRTYTRIHGIRTVPLRLTNVYGPRGQMKHSQFGVVNWFVRLALEGKPIPIFGSGKILRDFLYVDDCVEALLAAAADGDRRNLQTHRRVGVGGALAKRRVEPERRGRGQTAPHDR